MKTFAQTNAFQKYVKNKRVFVFIFWKVDRVFISVNTTLYAVFIVLISVFSAVSKVTPSVCKGENFFQVVNF